VNDNLVGIAAALVFGVIPAAMAAAVATKLPRRRYLLLPLAVGLSVLMTAMT